MSSLSSEVIRKFANRVDISVDYYRELLLAVHQKRRQASLETMLAEQFALNTVVLWEVFLSDLLMAYVAEDTSPYMRSLRERMEQSVREKFGNEALRCMAIDLPSSVSATKIAAWLDPKDFNLTFKSASALQSRANNLLAAPFAKKFSMDKESSQFLDFAIALRNYLAHRSTASRRLLQGASSVLSGANAEFNVAIRDVGSYLKTRLPGGDPRAALLASRLRALAAALA